MARLPLPDSDAVVAEAPHLFESLDIDDLNAARAMGNNPPLLAGVLEYMDVLYEGLSFADRELVILATARALDSRYEWHQHVTVAHEAGIPPATIRAIGRDDREALTDREQALVAFVHRQCRGTQTDDSYAALEAYYDPDEIAAIGMLTAHYTGVGQFLESMAVPLEDPFVGWEPTLES